MEETSERALEAGVERRTTIALSAAVLLGCVLRLTGLDVHSLWFDEGGTLAVAFSDDVVATLRGDRHPPLAFLAIRCSAAAFGESDAALRLVPAIASSLALVAFAYLARLWQEPRTCVASVALYAVAPFHVWHGQEVRAYAFLDFAAVIGLCGAAQFVRGRLKSGAALTAVGQALALGLHYFGVLLFASVGAIALLGWRTRRLSARQAAGLVASALVGVLVWVPWIVAMVPDQLVAEGGFAARLGWRDFLELPLRQVLVELSAIPAAWRPAGVVLAALLTLGFALDVIQLVRRRDAVRWMIALAFVAPVAAALVSALFVPPNFQAKYLMVAAPASALMIAGGLSALPWPLVRHTCVALAIGGCLTLTLWQKRANLREDYRSACGELVAAWRPGDRLVVVSGTSDRFSEGAVNHYLRARPDIFSARVAEDSFQMAVARRQLGDGRLHVIYREAGYARPILDWLDRNARRLHCSEQRFRIQHCVYAYAEPPGLRPR